MSWHGARFDSAPAPPWRARVAYFSVCSWGSAFLFVRVKGGFNRCLSIRFSFTIRHKTPVFVAVQGVQAGRLDCLWCLTERLPGASVIGTVVGESFPCVSHVVVTGADGPCSRRIAIYRRHLVLLWMCCASLYLICIYMF